MMLSSSGPANMAGKRVSTSIFISAEEELHSSLSQRRLARLLSRRAEAQNIYRGPLLPPLNPPPPPKSRRGPPLGGPPNLGRNPPWVWPCPGAWVWLCPSCVCPSPSPALGSHSG